MASLPKMNEELLEQVFTHNLNPERGLGFINCELRKRCAKAQPLDLIEKGLSGSFYQFGKLVKKGGNIPELVLEWNLKKIQQKAKLLQNNYTTYISAEGRKIKHLDILKSLVTSMQLCQFISAENLAL